MRKYYDDATNGKDLGLFKDFLAELKVIYGRKDDREGAKTELTVTDFLVS